MTVAQAQLCPGTIYCGDCLDVMRQWPDACVDCCVTSPPYWGLRDYGVDGQIGQEATPDAFVAAMVAVFAEVRRVLKPEGTCWLNLGDAYLNKSLVGIPWRVAFALQADGWYLRSDIIWAKPNPMPESVTDRPTSAHEHLFLLTKSERYWYDADAIAEPIAESTKEWGGGKAGWGASNPLHSTPTGTHGPSARGEGRCGESDSGLRNSRNVWEIATRPYKQAHFATFPPELPRRCILAGCPLGGVVLDPFFGSGTTGMVAEQLGRKWLGIELNPQYIELAKQRTAQRGIDFAESAA